MQSPLTLADFLSGTPYNGRALVANFDQGDNCDQNVYFEK